MRFNLIARAALLLLVATPAAAQERRIQILVEGAASFDVVYHRAQTDSTGAAFGGLIGAGIQAGIEADGDSKKRETIRSHMSEGLWADSFVKNFNEVVLAKGFEPVWVDKDHKDKGADADVYLVLFPESYGFRMVDSSTHLVSAYVEFDAIYSRQKIDRRKKQSKEAFYVTGQKQSSYDDLVSEAATLNANVESVMAQAARRLANKIIYNAK